MAFAYRGHGGRDTERYEGHDSYRRDSKSTKMNVRRFKGENPCGNHGDVISTEKNEPTPVERRYRQKADNSRYTAQHIDSGANQANHRRTQKREQRRHPIAKAFQTHDRKKMAEMIASGQA